MQKKVTTILSVIPLLVGFEAIFGWWSHIRVLLQLNPTQAPMHFNSAICFLVSGIILFFSVNPMRQTQRLQMVGGLFILVMAALTLSEDLFNIDFHIDQLCVHCWIDSSDPHPGRMSPNTSLSFIFSGLTFMLLPYAHKTLFAVITELFIFLVFLFGISGLTGHLLQLEYLYSWFSYTQMSFLSAVSFIASSLCLWSIWRSSPWSDTLYEGRQDIKIILVNTAILLAVVLTVGLSTLTQNLHLIVLVSTVAIFVGLLMLRLEVVPLVRRVIDAEQELLRANKRMRETEEHYSLAIRGSHIGLWDWVVGAEQVYSSPYLKAMLGYAEHQMPDTVEFYRSIIHLEDVDRVFSLIDQHLLHHVPFDIEFRVKLKTGEYRWFHSVGQAIWDANGRATRMAGSITDISEQKQKKKLTI